MRTFVRNKMVMILVGLYVSLVPCKSVFSQISPLGIGDSMPDLLFEQVYNYSSDTLRLSDLIGKTILLDFWGIYCIPCLKAFPKIDSLQKDFEEQIQVLAVSMTSLEDTREFFDSRPLVYKPGIPFITGDSILHQLFPHMGVPYLVWIDKKGTISHFSDGHHLTRENVNRFLADGVFDVPLAIDNVYKESLIEPTFRSDVLFASYLVRSNSNRGLILTAPISENMYTSAGSIKELYQHLYRQFGDISFDPFRVGRTQLQVRNPISYTPPTYSRGENLQAWHDAHYYYYQIQIPNESERGIFDLINADFERYFPVQCLVEKRLVDCLVLVRADSVDRLSTKGGDAMHSFFPQDIRRPKLDTLRYYVNRPFSWLSQSLGVYIETVSGAVFFDETDYEGNVDVIFNGTTLDHPSIENLRDELGRYGLKLVEQQRELDVLILKDIDN